MGGGEDPLLELRGFNVIIECSDGLFNSIRNITVIRQEFGKKGIGKM